ncbi:MAG: hypothetical protein AAGJ40_11725 [Planctomycetota bacterium]
MNEPIMRPAQFKMLAAPAWVYGGHRRIGHRSGVTLLEAIMVIMILSAALIATPGFSRTMLPSTSIDADAREVARLLRNARETALLHRCTVEVRRIRAVHPGDGQRRHAVVWRALPSPYAVNTFLAGPIDNTGNRWLAEPIWMTSQTVLSGSPTTIRFTDNNRIDRIYQWQLDNEDEQRTVTASSTTNSIEVSQ